MNDCVTVLSGDYQQQILVRERNSCKGGHTFNLIGGSSAHFSLTVFEEVLEGWHEVVLCDFWTDCLL